jgi:hypothetical protein
VVVTAADRRPIVCTIRWELDEQALPDACGEAESAEETR